MTVYIVQLLIILLLGAWFHPATNEKGRKSFLFSCFIILVVISGIRGYSVGSDTGFYIRMYETIESVPNLYSRYEVGFIVYLRILHFISADPSLLLWISSLICVGTSCLFTYHYSKRPTNSILLYIMLGSYFSQMNIMRQTIALSITMWAFMLIMNPQCTSRGKIVRSIFSALLILLASSFHTVAIVAFMPWILIVYRIYHEDDSKLTMQYVVLRTLVFSVIVVVGYSVLMRVVSMIFPSYANYFTGRWSDSNYFASLLKTMISVVFLIVGAVVLKGKKLTFYQRFAVIMLGLTIVSQVLSIRMEIWGRVVGVFEIYTQLLWVPDFIDEIQNKNNRWIVETAIIAFSFLYMVIILVFRPEWTSVVPYVVYSII